MRIGLVAGMFAILGALLAGFGVYASMATPEIYKKSLDINVNLWWGLVMLVFGLVMVVMGRRGERRAESEALPGDERSSSL